MVEKFCTKCGKKFYAIGREVICPSCREAAAEATKKAAVERAKMRSYTGEACPVRISARARGFIEAVAQAQGSKFIPALDAILQAVCKDYGFESWQKVPEHKTARRGERAAGKPQEAPQEVKQDAPQDVQDEPVKPVKQAAKKAVKTTAGKKGGKA